MYRKQYSKRKRNHDIFVFIIVAILMLSVAFTLVQQRKTTETLEVYTKTDKVQTEETDKKEEEPEIETDIYTDTENGYSIAIPVGWTQANQKEGVTFVHAASGTSIQIQVKNYDPAVNNMNAESASAKVAEDGKTFVDFTRVNASHYEVRYQDMQEAVYDYVEEVYWDRDRVYTILCVLNDVNYEKVLPYLDKAIGSFSWKASNAIPEGYVICYNQEGGFEVGIPETWTVSSAGTSIAATDNATGSSMSANKVENTAWLSNLSTVDIKNIFQEGRENFMIVNYEKGKKSAKVTLKYTLNGVYYTNETYLNADGKYWYLISFDYEEGMLDVSIPDESAGLFRKVSTKK